MKHNKKLIIFIISLLGLGFSVFGITATTQAGTINSRLHGVIGFKENEEDVVAVNPSNPDEEIEPNGKVPTGGPLSISYVSDFDFGSHPQSGRDERYSAALTTVIEKNTKKKHEEPNFVQITDNRGSKKGWKLYVQQNSLLKNQEGFEIKGSNIDLQNIVPVALYGSVDRPNKVPKSAVLNGETKEKILVAEASPRTGMGSWQIQFGETEEQGRDSVGITIPGKSEKKAGKYRTSLTWTLEDSF